MTLNIRWVSSGTFSGVAQSDHSSRTGSYTSIAADLLSLSQPRSPDTSAPPFHTTAGAFRWPRRGSLSTVHLSSASEYCRQDRRVPPTRQMWDPRLTAAPSTYTLGVAARVSHWPVVESKPCMHDKALLSAS